MIWIFILAAILAVVMYHLGAYVTVVAVVANLVKITFVLTGGAFAYWLVRRWMRRRRGREVPQIPRL